MEKKVLILIPAYNEEESLPAFLNKLCELDLPFLNEILIVNDGSSDNTAGVASQYNVTVINQVKNNGYGSSLQLGYKYAQRNKFDYVIQLDGDGQHDVSNIEKIYNLLSEDNADIVIGSRFFDESISFKMSKIKLFVISIFTLIIKILTGVTIKDPTSGLQGLNRYVIEYYSKYNQFDSKYPDINMVMQMIMQGYRIIEIPAVMHERIAGESMHSGIIKPLKYMVIISLSALAVVLRNRKNYNFFQHKVSRNNFERE